MTIEVVYRELGLSELEPGLRAGWQESLASFPGMPLVFLTGAYIREYAPLASLPDDAIDHLIAVADRAAHNEPLSLLLWHEHRVYTGRALPDEVTSRRPHRRHRKKSIPFLDEEFDPSGFPDLSPCSGPDAPGLNLLIALSALPHAAWFYESRRIPKSVLSETLSDLAVWYSYYQRQLGQSGISVGTLSWLKFHLHGRLFRLGRLQFMQGSFPRDLTVYRSTITGEIRALAAAGFLVDANGLLIFEEDNDRGIWTTARGSDGECVTGNPIDPSGRVVREPVTLDIEEYRPILEEHTPILEIHIPEGGAMSPEACRASLHRALEFFPAHFPERSFRAFTCESWFLGRELLDLLPPDSNIVRFSELLRLYPALGGHEEILGRVFGPRALEMDASKWDRSSTLQRKLAEIVERGGVLREGGGFLLTDELPRA